MKREVAIIVPLYNEEENLRELYERMIAVNLGGRAELVQILFVDDGSTDSSAEVLRSLASRDQRVRLISHESKRGLSSALQTGFDRAEGNTFVTLDADLQNDPEDVPLLLEELERGFDLIIGWRERREDRLSRRVASRIAAGLRRIIFKDRIHDVGCGLRAMEGRVGRALRLSGGLHRYLSVLAARKGFQVTEIKVRHHPRKKGRSKFGNLDRALECLSDLPKVFKA